MRNKASTLYFFRNTWWVFIFAALSFSIFAYLRHNQTKQLHQLQSVISKLEVEKKQAKDLQKEYKLKVASFDDPAYIEMVLMQSLGLVPKDQVKVIY